MAESTSWRELVDRVLGRKRELSPLVRDFKIIPELEELTKELAELHSRSIGLALYGSEKTKAELESIHQRRAEILVKHGDELKNYLQPYLALNLKEWERTVDEEWYRWMAAGAVERKNKIQNIRG